MIAKRTHAVVLGGSVAGLFTARVLSDHFERVTIVERDGFPPLGEHRKGVPQSWHAHGMLASGHRIVNDLLPGFTAEAAASGALEIDIGADVHWCVGGVRLAETPTDLRALLLSRPLLEASVRERVLALGNVAALTDCDVFGLLEKGDVIEGVRYRTRGREAREEQLIADLVVDATGRGSRMPAWLHALGLPAPAEERVRVDCTYTTRLYHRKPHHLQGKSIAIAGVRPPNRRSGIAIAQEGDRWIVSLVGYLRERPPLASRDYIQYAATLSAPDIHRLLLDAEPISEPATGRFSHEQRRRYERLRRFPRGLLVIGDALASFNPAYGQGMSVAALEARLLDACLRAGAAELAARFFPAAARIIDVPWSIALGNDLKFEEVEGRRTAFGRMRGAYMTRLQRAAATDPVVSRAFLEMAQLCAPVSSLFKPAILRRVLWPARTTTSALLENRSLF